MVDFLRAAPTSSVLLVDGVGRTVLHDIGPRVVLPSVVEYELPDDDVRVEMQGDGCRLIVKSRRFERTDEAVTRVSDVDRGPTIPIYRLEGAGRPPIRRTER